jgi:hypothetical protein
VGALVKIQKGSRYSALVKRVLHQTRDQEIFFSRSVRETSLFFKGVVEQGEGVVGDLAGGRRGLGGPHQREGHFARALVRGVGRPAAREEVR